MGPLLGLNVLFFHGFLGKAADGEPLRRDLGSLVGQWQAWDLLHFAPDIEPAPAWAAKVLPQIQLKRERVFVGYSMGGRLGLHLFEKDPTLFDRWIFLSTNPGLADDAEKAARLRADETWAKKFETDPADVVLKDWHAQPVFAGTYEPDRHDRMKFRAEWAKCLRDWSLGHQKDFRALLKKHEDRIHWVAGKNDLKFAGISRELGLKNTLIVEGAGHRLLGDAPAAISDLLRGVVGQKLV